MVSVASLTPIIAISGRGRLSFRAAIVASVSACVIGGTTPMARRAGGNESIQATPVVASSAATPCAGRQAMPGRVLGAMAGVCARTLPNGGTEAEKRLDSTASHPDRCVWLAGVPALVIYAHWQEHAWRQGSPW